MPAAEEKRRVGETVGKGNAALEFIYGSLSGLAFGMISPLASQPFDTIKTRMQAELRFAGQGPFTVGSNVLRAEGMAGFYRGMVPILASTSLQKSALFAAYAGARRTCEQSGIPVLTHPIPFSGGLMPSIIVGGIASGTARAIVETPFELAKVRRQTGGSFRASAGVFSVSQITELYTGVFETWGRGTIMLTSFFVMCDYTEKCFPGLVSQPLLGGFIKGGFCATAAWGIAWPIEVVKSKVQCADSSWRGKSTLSIMGSTLKAEGVKGLYRGFLPGAMRSFVANGAGMAAFQLTQSWRTD